MADRLGKQLQDQRALLAAVSHELRSPLGRARVLVELSREGSAPASLHDDLQAEILSAELAEHQAMCGKLKNAAWLKLAESDVAA